MLIPTSQTTPNLQSKWQKSKTDPPHVSTIGELENQDLIRWFDIMTTNADFVSKGLSPMRL